MFYRVQGYFCPWPSSHEAWDFLIRATVLKSRENRLEELEREKPARLERAREAARLRTAAKNEDKKRAEAAARSEQNYFLSFCDSFTP